MTATVTMSCCLLLCFQFNLPTESIIKILHLFQHVHKHYITQDDDGVTFFSWFGIMQRTKFAFVLFSVCISLLSCSLYVCPTVRNIPLRVAVRPPPNGPTSATAAAMPTISATVTHAHCTMVSSDSYIMTASCQSTVGIYLSSRGRALSAP